MKRHSRIHYLLLAAVTLVALATPGAYAQKESGGKLTRGGKVATGEPAPLDRARLQPIFDRLRRNYSAPRHVQAQPERPSPLLQWARSDRGIFALHLKDATAYQHLKRGVVAVSPKAGGRTLAAPQAGEGSVALTRRYVAENRRLFGLTGSPEELRVTKQNTDHLGMRHVFFQQTHAGVPLWGRQLVAHFDAAQNLVFVNCLLEPSPRRPAPQPVFSAAKALAIAERRLADMGNPMQLTPKQATRLGFGPSSAELFYWQEQPRATLELVWVVELRPNLADWMRFFIRTEDGKILEVYNATKFSQSFTASAPDLRGQTVTFNTYEIGGKYYMLDGTKPMFVAGQSDENLINDPKGVVGQLDLRQQDANNQATLWHFESADNSWSDPAAVSGQVAAAQVYDFYRNLDNHNRNSFDNAGAAMLILQHVTMNGAPMDNAFWNGSFVALGDGDTMTTNWAGALDFIAHEFTHAHIQHTANLEYKFQSGALNETFADIGGVAVDSDDFLLGEDIIVGSAFPSGAMRNMGDPHNGGSGQGDLNTGWQPAHMSEYLDLTIGQDNGGVHINNGISNFAAYKIMTAIGRHNGQQVLYRALVNYLTTQSNFADFRIAAVRSATELFGAASAQETAVKTAFDEVGLVETGGGGGVVPPDDIPVVAGSQYIVMVNDEIDPAPDNSLVITSPFNAIEQWDGGLFYMNAARTQVNWESGRPIAVDPYGQDIYFVGLDNNLRAVRPDGTGEELLSLGVPDWWSVAISPSGRRLAMTTKFANDNRIYVLNTETNTETYLTLFHPTTEYGEGSSDIVDYADSLVFLDDQLLAYDCRNSLNRQDGTDYTFWDVNVIDVVNGEIFSVLPPQGDDVSVVNPIIASTNNTIMTVEIAQADGIIESHGINLITGDRQVIYNNTGGLTFPDYSSDDRHMVFDYRSTPGEPKNLWLIPLGADKISAGGDPSDSFNGFNITAAQLPVWFVAGAPPTATVGFASASSGAAENVGQGVIQVNLSEASGAPITVDYAVTGGNATPQTDFVLDSGRLTFNPGVTSANIAFTITNDTAREPSETITLTLSRPVNAWLGANVTHQFTINDDDGVWGCFVDHQYLDFLGRAAEPAGHDFYVNHLSGGTMTKNDVVRNFIASPEFADFNGFIARCYFCIFNNNSATNYDDPGYRVPDYGGMVFHLATMKQIERDTGDIVLAKVTVAAQFINSPEWQLRVGSLTDPDFVDFLYVNILGRPAEAAGHAYHLDNLQNSRVTREALAVQFIDSPEAAATYSNHTYVVMAYLGLLDRAAEKLGFDYHMGRLVRGEVDVVTFLAGFINSPEYINRLAGFSCTFPE